MMRKIYLSLLLIILIPLVSHAQFATSKYRYARADIPNTRLEFDIGSGTFAAPSSIQILDAEAGTFVVGARIGFILSKLRSSLSNSAFRPGMVIGPEVMYYFTNQITFISGLLFHIGGSNFDGGTSNIRQTTLSIPLMVGYWITEQWMATAGFQLGFILGTKDLDDNENINEFFKGVDFGIKFGVAYQATSQLLARFTYYNGFANLYDSENSDASLKSSILSLSIAYYLRTLN